MTRAQAAEHLDHLHLMVQAAEHLARWLHRDQKDLQGEPYVGHLARVAGYVREHGGTAEQIAAAWLHDSIEDGWATIRVIVAIFPASVVNVIYHLSRCKIGHEPYDTYINRLVSDHRAKPALLVKLADLKDNMDRSRGPAPERLMRRYERALPKIEAALEGRTA